MKNLLLPILIFSLLIFSCNKKEDKNYTAIAGKVTNPQSDSVYIFLNDRDKAILLNENGEFHDTIQLKDKGYYYFSDGREQAEIFLFPGDSLYLTVDTQQFDETIFYQGKGAEKNNYLAQKLLKEETIGETSAQIFSLSPAEFAEKFSNLTTELESQLKESKAEQTFIDLETKNLQYGYLSLLLQYPDAHKYFTGNEMELPDDFLKELDNINFDNEEEYNLIPTYQDLVINKYMLDIEQANNLENLETMIAQLKSNTIKQDILQALFFRISSTNPDSEKINSIIKNHSSNPDLIKKAETRTESIKNLLAGKPAPKFTFADVNGKETSLDQLNGKLVYIDVWATWCGPCIQEIPALKQLESDYRDKNVAFLSISIDSEKDYSKWVKMLKEKELQGIQLFAKGEVKENFTKSYGIDAIPRFILIDQNGNIIQADAPRPSQKQIRELLDQNL